MTTNQKIMRDMFKSILSEFQQVGLEFNIGELQKFSINPDKTITVEWVKITGVYQFDGTLIRSFENVPNIKP